MSDDTIEWIAFLIAMVLMTLAFLATTTYSACMGVTP